MYAVCMFKKWLEIITYLNGYVALSSEHSFTILPYEGLICTRLLIVDILNWLKNCMVSYYLENNGKLLNAKLPSHTHNFGLNLKKNVIICLSKPTCLSKPEDRSKAQKCCHINNHDDCISQHNKITSLHLCHCWFAGLRNKGWFARAVTMQHTG